MYRKQSGGGSLTLSSIFKSQCVSVLGKGGGRGGDLTVVPVSSTISVKTLKNRQL